MTKACLAFRLAAVALAAALGLASAATAATLSTTAQFSRFSGDIDLPGGFFEAYINDVVVPPFSPPQVNADDWIEVPPLPQSFVCNIGAMLLIG